MLVCYQVMLCQLFYVPACFGEALPSASKISSQLQAAIECKQFNIITILKFVLRLEGYEL